MRRFLLLILLILVPVSLAQQATPEPNPILVENLRVLATTTEQLRALRLGSDLPLHFPNRDELRAYIGKQLDLALTDEAVAQSTRFYVTFGLLPADIDLKAMYNDFYGSQVAGFYDSETKEMNVVLMVNGSGLRDNLPLLERIVYVHEYVHALQDQAFDLTTYLQDPASVTNSDRALARLALVEGDASATMNLYTIMESQRDPVGTMFSALFGSLQAGNLTLPEGTPKIIADELLFPYTAGENFVRALYSDTGSWEGVNQAFSNPPASSEHILHPETYLAGEIPVAVTLPDASQKLGSEWSLANEGVLGEFYLREYLGTQVEATLASDAAQGWGGDAYHIYTTADGQSAWMLRLEWDTDADLQVFQSAIAQFAEKKYGVVPDNNGCYVTDAQAFCTNGHVILVAPTEDLALSMVSE